MTWEEAVNWLRDQPEKEELVRACFYDDPLEDAAERYYASEEWKALQSLIGILGEIDHVLDIGAGRGISSYAFSKSGNQVVALEPDPSALVGAGAIQTLNARLERSIEIVQDWGESLPFDDHRFDLVYGRAVFHHARNIAEFCEEAYRVLKPGGLLLLTREHVIDQPGDLEVFLERHPLHHLYGGECAYQLSEYKGALSSAGFEIEKVFSPREIAVNYFPVTEADLRNLARKRIQKRHGKILGSLLSMSSANQDRELRKWDEEDTTPGRLYSFLARK